MKSGDKVDVCFKNAKIVTMDYPLIIENKTICVKGDKIVYIGEDLDFKSKRIINAKGKILMPGLINSHTHIPMSVLRGYADDYELEDWLFNYIFKAEAKFDAKVVEIGSKLSICEMLSTGTTSINDMYFMEEVVADVVADSGIRANLCAGSLCFEEKYEHNKDPFYNSFIEMYDKFHNFDDGRIKIDVGIHAEYTSNPNLWIFWADVAKEKNLNAHMHLSETFKEHQNCKIKYGKTPTKLLESYGLLDTGAILAHCVHLEQEDIDIIKQKNATVSHNPVSNLKLASGTTDINSMLKKGVNIALGTDGVASNNTFDLFEEIKLSSILCKGITQNAKSISAIDSLKMATLGGAKSQKRDNIGMLKIGFDADIIMIDFENIYHIPTYNIISSLVYNTSGRDVVLNMVKGRILYENGIFNTIDLEKVIYDLNNYAILKIKGDI